MLILFWYYLNKFCMFQPFVLYTNGIFIISDTLVSLQLNFISGKIIVDDKGNYKELKIYDYLLSIGRSVLY